MQHPASRQSPADTITATIIAKLEAGTRPWVQPWTGASISRPLRACGTPYHGINVLWLWMAAQAAGHTSPFWMTYRQSQLLGGQVRKGERGTVAIFYRSYQAEQDDEGGENDCPRTRRVLKSFAVFNACQIDGLPDRFFQEPRPLPPRAERNHVLDCFFAAIPAMIRHGGAEAFYSPALDQVTMPEPSLFRDLDHYRHARARAVALDRSREPARAPAGWPVRQRGIRDGGAGRGAFLRDARG